MNDDDDSMNDQEESAAVANQKMILGCGLMPTNDVLVGVLVGRNFSLAAAPLSTTTHLLIQELRILQNKLRHRAGTTSLCNCILTQRLFPAHPTFVLEPRDTLTSIGKVLA